MITADLHCDTVLRMEAGENIVRPTVTSPATGHIDLPRLRTGAVGLQAFAAYVPAQTPNGSGFGTARAKLERIRRLADDHHDVFTIVTSSAEAWGAIGRGAERDAPGLPERAEKIGILLTVENGAAIDGEVANLDRLRVLGVRSMTLVHAEHLPWVASCTGAGSHEGLTETGREVVREMARTGVLVDVSHASGSAFWQIAKTMEPTGKPYIASHSNAASICSHPRNLTDDQIRALAASGGVIGVNFYPAFLDQHYYEEIERRKAAGMTEASFHERTADLSVPSERVVQHVEHMVALVGWDHVAFGSDFDGIPVTPTGLSGSDGYPALLEQLRTRGAAETDLEKLAWRNALRVLEAAEA